MIIFGYDLSMKSSGSSHTSNSWGNLVLVFALHTIPGINLEGMGVVTFGIGGMCVFLLQHSRIWKMHRCRVLMEIKGYELFVLLFMFF